jgi:anaerobic sulfite reductase subunit C
MRWQNEARDAVSKVPFFVRKRVIKRVEEEAARLGAEEVGMEHVRACQKKFLSNMEDEVKGYHVETCFGASGCTNRATVDDRMAENLDRLLAAANLKELLKRRVSGPLKLHHELRISISDCPNACSRPQIVDIGLIGACLPAISQETCTECATCVEVCRESAITLHPSASPRGDIRDGGETVVQIPIGGCAPIIDRERCLSCGACVAACHSGTLAVQYNGYRILLGGRLGRHPRLGREIGGIYSSEQTLGIVQLCVDHYLKHNQSGERFGDILNRVGMPDLPIIDHFGSELA